MLVCVTALYIFSYGCVKLGYCIFLTIGVRDMRKELW